MKLTFKDILEKEKRKLVKVKPWHSYVYGKDVPHKNKKAYNRKNTKGFDYD